MNKKSFFLVLLSGVFIITASTISMANDTSGDITGGVKDDRMEKQNADWNRNRPVDKSKRDHGYNVIKDEKPAEPKGISGGVKDDRMERNTVDWERERPVDKSKRDHGYNIEQNKQTSEPSGISGGVEDNRMDRGNADWSPAKKE